MADSKYGRIIVEGKDIPEGEPLFVLRGQDEFAAFAVEMYAALRWASGDIGGYYECMDVASSMRAWPTKKRPD